MCLVGATFLHLFIGNLYLWGNIAPYVISYLHYQGDPDANDDKIIMVIPISFLLESFACNLGSYLQKRYNNRVTIAVFGILCLGSIFGASQVKTFKAFMMFYGVLFPIGIGVIYFVALMAAWEWFGPYKGFCTGVIVAGFGFGTFIFSFITTGIVNPHDQGRVKDPITGESFFPEDVAERVPKMFIYCILIWSVFTMIGVICVERNPEFVKEEKARI